MRRPLAAVLGSCLLLSLACGPGLSEEELAARKEAREEKKKADAAAAAEAAAERERYGAWSVDSETSKMTDQVNVVGVLASKDQVKDWVKSTHRPDLVIRCKDDKTEMYIRAGAQLEVEYGLYGQSTVTFRPDKEKAETMIMSQGTDNRAAFFQQPRQWAEFFTAVEVLTVELNLFKAGKQVVQFDMKGTDAVVADIREACHW